ncbi:hypothetical protein BIU96_07260 [Curtobacterium sp. MCBA15_008]|nr:hypothetical protein BIU96_07260 [Curtobacterium sp. MCBA15_008]
MGSEVGRWSVAVDWHVEQIADARLQASLFAQFSPTSLTEALTFLHPTTREHPVVPTVFQSIDDEQALILDDDGG